MSPRPRPIRANGVPNATPASVALGDPLLAGTAWSAGRLLSSLKRDPVFAIAAITLLLVALAALFAPWLAPFDPDQPIDMAARAQPPSAGHWLGTDALNRDLLSRILFGARISLAVSLLSVAAAMVVGTAWGAVAGYAGGWIDALLMRVVDAGLAIPRILLLLCVVSLWGTLTVPAIIVVLGFTGWFAASRLVRDGVRASKERDYAVAAQASGATPARVLVRHVLPHALTPILVAATLSVGQVVVIEAGLSFLGYGVAPPAATWGSLIRDGRENVATAWWLSVFPGLALATTVLAINVLGDRLRTALGGRQLPAP
jgi:peptide/nickel transport system permease protein